MGKLSNDWQDTNLVLELFGSMVMSARKRYHEFVSKGIEQGKRSDLVGGGLVRSMGGWSEVKKHQKEQVPMKGDERILGNSAFVSQILSQAEENFEKRYYLKTVGMNLDMLAQRVLKSTELKSGTCGPPENTERLFKLEAYYVIGP